MNKDAIISAFELLGADEKQLKRLETVNFNFGVNPKERIKKDLTVGTIEERQTKMLSLMKKTLKSFENSDVVECDNSLLNEEMIDIMWKNINIYSYDIETFFLNKCIFYLKDKQELLYKMYFSLENGDIFLYVEDDKGDAFVGGVILIREGRFIPSGAITNYFYNGMIRYLKDNNMPIDREFAANRTLLNCLLYLLLVNQMVNQNKEVITETSRRIDITKKKKSNKKVQKRTKQIRYIKVDSIKVKKVREEYERQTRESYNRHVAEWSRRGYWTTLRNGKKHWVKPTTCHAKDKVENKVNKIYKLV